MKKGTKLHGFLVEDKEYLEEASGTLYSLRHEKHATPLLFLERDDSNKSFYIAFKTLPEDDTGVFHIIEHSVLCGSKKFPVKEPFVELLKTSLKTFLNAMTYPDRTVYPVCSRSDKDFFNLTDVYLDAVFHPLMLENESIFMQEGHHPELSEDALAVTENGVVYNEMKGAVSSPDDLSQDELMKMLYKGTTYAKNSGGDPDAIPELTYENFRAAHAKYYHPRNARIFLDGKVNLDEILPLIDSYLTEFEATDTEFHVGDCPPVTYEEKTVEYELSRDESPANKARAYIGYRTADFDDVQTGFELSVLTDAIAGSNEAPLTSALLSSGLVEDAGFFSLGEGIKFGAHALELKNVKDGKTDEVMALAEKTLTALARDGIDSELLLASLNSREFRLREKDFGSTPLGLVFGLAILDSWIYGAPPKNGICYESILKEAREKLSTGHYEKLLEKYFVNNEQKMKLTLTPSTSLGIEREKKERRLAEERRQAMTDAELSLMKEKNARFDEWQESADTEEGLATLPTLTVSDVPKEIDIAPTEVKEINGVTVLVHDVPTSGIDYAELYFDVCDLDEKELSLASLIASLIGKCPTENHTAKELEKMKKSTLGALFATPVTFRKGDKVYPYIKLTASALKKNRKSLVGILSEVVNGTLLSDVPTVSKIVKQKIIAMKEGFITSGHAAAIRRAGAYLSEGSTITECFTGVEMYKTLCGVDSLLTETPATACEKLTSLFKRIFTRSRLTVGFTGEPDDELVLALSNVPNTVCTPPVLRKIAPLGIKSEGFIIPSRVSYIGKASTLDLIGEKFSGSMCVISNILSYTHLWNAVRVRGGAYGAGFFIRQTGSAYAYSYRDPSPASSVKAVDESADFLSELAKSGESLDGYIIGTFGDYDVLTTPRSRGSEATGLFLSGKTEEDEKALRAEMLAFDEDELLRLSDVVRRLTLTSAVCVFGPKEQLEACGEILQEIKEI